MKPRLTESQRRRATARLVRRITRATALAATGGTAALAGVIATQGAAHSGSSDAVTRTLASANSASTTSAAEAAAAKALTAKNAALKAAAAQSAAAKAVAAQQAASAPVASSSQPAATSGGS